MALVETVKTAAMEQMQQIAETIEGELIGIVSGHSRSGLAVGAIHIERRGDTSFFIGGTNGTGKGITGTDHLAMLDQGNGSEIIYPTEKRALKFTDGSIHGSARPYAGIHFVREVANRHR